MSLNIPKKFIDISVEAKLILDTEALGPREKKALQRGLHTGVTQSSNTVVGKLVVVLREREKLPTVTIRDGSWGYVEWHNITEEHHKFFDLMQAAIVGYELIAKPDSNEYWSRRAENAIADKPVNGGCGGLEKIPKRVLSNLKLPPYTLGTPRFIHIDLTKENL